MTFFITKTSNRGYEELRDFETLEELKKYLGALDGEVVMATPENYDIQLRDDVIDFVIEIYDDYRE